MKKHPILAGALALLLSGAAVALPPPSPLIGKHLGSAADHQAIEALLQRYTQCIDDRDEAGFRALLLDDHITFSWIASGPPRDGKPQAAPDFRRFEDFRQAIFVSSERYRQTIYNVQIAQDGLLAQASLDFVTRSVKDGSGSYGWKVLQLVKVNGQWKIVSELFTARALQG